MGSKVVDSGWYFRAACSVSSLVKFTQSSLSLEVPPDVRVDFTMVNDPSISGTHIVLSIYGHLAGMEFWSSDKVFVIITNIAILIK
jgi:hypothetical protein